MPIKAMRTEINTDNLISRSIAEAKLTGQSSFTIPNWEGKPCQVIIKVVDIPEEQAEIKRKTVEGIFERKFAEWFMDEYLPEIKGNSKDGEKKDLATKVKFGKGGNQNGKEHELSREN